MARDLKLFLVSQSENRNYDTYDSFIVAAENYHEARMTHPDRWKTEDLPWDGKVGDYSTWCNADLVTVQYLGEPAYWVEKGVVLASFNAG